MADRGSLEALLNTLPDDIRKPLVAYTREWVKSLRFGAPSSSAVAAENFGGHLVPLVTSGTANAEVAVAHNLARIPRLLIPLLPLDTVNATLPILTVTKAADATYFYVKSATTSAHVWTYCE